MFLKLIVALEYFNTFHALQLSADTVSLCVVLQFLKGFETRVTLGVLVHIQVITSLGVLD
jgi:hypothetical protein